MLNRKMNRILRILGPVLGSMTFALIIGVMELMPAYTDDTAAETLVNNLTLQLVLHTQKIKTIL